MAEIRIFHTHIEVYPYEKGDCPEIEKMMSKYDSVTHSRIPIGYYIQNDILYLPRGVNVTLLQELFHTTPTPVTKPDTYNKIKKGTALNKPKSRMQSNAIDFLCSEGQYSYSGWYSQFGLNLDTGDGKTYAAITAVMKMKLKTIIITHKDKLKSQWEETLKDRTSFPMENYCNISGTGVMDQIMKGEIRAEIYCVNHQTINSYARIHGWTSIRDFFKKIKVGIKIIDEAHLFFESTLMIDYFSNVYKSFYLTATFGRSDSSIGVYKRAFSSMVRFGEETVNYNEKRRHIVLFVVYFTSNPEYGIVPNLKTAHGFSAYKYIDYELSGSDDSLRKVLFNILDQTKNLDGKKLILSPKIESADIIAKNVEEYTGCEVGTIHSKNSIETNRDAINKDIISSTIKSFDAGNDIRGLRVLINLEPIGSRGLADQVRGRLREYSDTDDTFLFIPVDTAVKESMEYIKNILPVMKKKCKKIVFLNSK